VLFKTKALDDFAGCSVRVRNIAKAKSAQNTTEISDYADVVITKENCNPGPGPGPGPTPTTPITGPGAGVSGTPTSLVNTGPGTTAVAVFIVTTVLGSLAYRWNLARRLS
ncbi:hypothetical protein EBZ57_03750, partial [bacterium]|nr:hypothetical protein [bacterium]